MKAISFLGFNPRGYTETIYQHPQTSDQCKTMFFQEALVEFYKPETLYVLLTNKAETGIPANATEATWKTLQKRLAGKVDLQPIKNVPETNSTDDIWRLFDMLTDCLQEGDRVIFDITHGFRSLPIVALIAVSYLRVVRKVTIEGLIYGAFDPTNTQVTPIFDLLPIVSLLEWTTATDQFIQTGNGQALAKLLHDSDTNNEPLANSINGIAQGLQLLRPMDVMEEAALLPTHIAQAADGISKSVPPFATLLKRVEADYGKFGLPTPKDYITNPQASLLRQLKIVKWSEEKGQTVQSLSLAREWLPSLLCYHFNLDPFNKENREEMELLLAGGKIKDRESLYLQQWSDIDKKKRKQLNNLWGGKLNLANLRNDVLHAGFRKNPKPPGDILTQVKEILEELDKLPNEWNLTDETV